MAGFVGRERELAMLAGQLDVVLRGSRADRGVAVLLRGRRRIGKSRLVTELIDRAGVPAVYWQAARHAPSADELAGFAAAIATSSLPNATIAEANRPITLTAGLRLLGAALPDDRPAIAVIDELPWLLEALPGGAGELQRVWDRELARKPVLMLLLGSDLGMMERLEGYDQPFHGRATPMVLEPLNPREIAVMTGLAGIEAIDASLITGGQPLVAQEWHHGEPPSDFVRRSFESSTSALIVSGARVLDAEFPPDTNPRAVLTAVGGHGERTYTTILGALGGRTSAATLDRALATLAEKRVIAADEPLSVKAAAKDRRWRVSDPALRFWLALVEPVLGDVDRGAPDLAVQRWDGSYPSWRGRAVEPVVRDALMRLLPDGRWPAIHQVGGWWPRSNTPEIDLVGADRRPAREIAFVGTIKWHATSPLARREITNLAQDAMHVPGVGTDTPLVAVCPAGATADERLRQVWTADDLLLAWS